MSCAAENVSEAEGETGTCKSGCAIAYFHCLEMELRIAKLDLLSAVRLLAKQGCRTPLYGN